MVQLILERLVHGTPPSAIAPNIASQAELMLPGKMCIRELPKGRCIRSCRTTLRIVGETLAAYRLARAGLWNQVYMDGTRRRQTALIDLVFSIFEDDKMMQLVLSCSII